MASFLARFLPGTSKPDTTPAATSDQPSGHAASMTKSTKRHSANVKARKSITSLFAITIDIIRPESRPDEPLEVTATCREAQHYPIYDPTNPDHEPRAVHLERTQDHPSSKRRSSRSPKKPHPRKQSSSPAREGSSTRTKSRLQGLADTLRAKANIFYEAQVESSEEELLLHEVGAPSTPKSVKSISSKKSVRFRSGHSVIDDPLPHTSPITIPTNSPPSLSMVDISNVPMFDTISDGAEDLGQLARPPESLLSHVPAGPSPRRDSLPPLSLNLGEVIQSAQALLTPMPGTNLPLEDPFDDSAAALHASAPENEIVISQGGPDECHLSANKGKAEVHETKIVSTSEARSFSAQSKPPSYKETCDSPNFEVSGSVSEAHDCSSDGNPSAVQRTLRRMKPLSHGNQSQSGFFRSSSEIQSEAEGEFIENHEAQKETSDRMTFKAETYPEIHLEHRGQGRPIGEDLVRCKARSLQCPTPDGILPHFNMQKPSPNQSDQIPNGISSDDAAVVESADHAEKEAIQVPTCSASDVGANHEQLEAMPVRGLRPELRPVAAPCDGIENAEPGTSFEPIKHEITRSSSHTQDPSARVCSTSSADSILPPHLSPTMSSISPSRSPWRLRGYRGTDEDVDVEISEHSSVFAREVAEESVQQSLSSPVQTAPSYTQSSADHALPLTVEPGSESMASSLCANEIRKASPWSPFDENEFASAAYSALERSPLALARRLRSEGITREFWKKLDLPDATAPSKHQNIYTDVDLLRLFAAIADRARITLPENACGVPLGSPLDYSNGPIIDIQALSTFNGPVSPLSLGGRIRDRRTSRNEAGVPESVSSIESIYSSRRSSLEGPFLLTKSRQRSTQALAVDEHQSPNDDQPSGLCATPIQAAPQPNSLHSSTSEMRPLVAHSPGDLSSQTAKDERTEFSAEAGECPESQKSQSPPAVMESADSYTHPRITDSRKVLVSARKKSSDESRDSNETMSSMMSGSTSSGCIVEWSHAMKSKSVLNISQQQPLATWNKVDLHREQAYEDTAYHEESYDVADTSK